MAGPIQQDAAGTYFIDWNGDRSIYRMSAAGDETKRLIKDKAQTMLLQGDWLYYVQESREAELYRVKTDGTEREQLLDHFVGLIGFDAEGVLYYRDSTVEYNIYRLDVDSKESHKLVAEWTNEALLADGFLYYVNNSDEGHLYRVNLAGSEREQISPFPVRMIAERNSAIIALGREDNALYLIDPADELHPNKLATGAISHYQSVGSYVVYKLDNGGLFRLEPQGGSSAPVSLVAPADDVYHHFFIQVDWLYYQDQPSPHTGKLKRIPLSDLGLEIN